ncbi:hypothetical protein AVDCRST_MAG94-4301 [uncultured Leptolyngbya sp.]|uniref:Uncharacterized protein n=1 Tax=uncultured Leptolyngbya sp. TaxID=332963 RepID=A0A6J4N354_9CYAN|nr:hypothetical protein AVDCRST_MAG94-4301 [uncultured Leptolyngbya sp.]
MSQLNPTANTEECSVSLLLEIRPASHDKVRAVLKQRKDLDQDSIYNEAIALWLKQNGAAA